jgi:glutamate synthase (NADPH/NADH) small chain
VKVPGDQFVTGVECVRIKICDLDDSGRPEPVPQPASNFVIDADMFIERVGQESKPLLVRKLEGIRHGKRVNIVIYEEGRSSLSKVYAAGNVAT